MSRVPRPGVLLAGSIAVGAAAFGLAARHRDLPKTPGVVAHARQLDLARLPLAFETNVGQTDAGVRFVARSGRCDVFVRPADAVFALPGAALAMRLEGASADAEVVAVDDLPGRVNYFLGDDPAGWHTEIPTCRRVESRSVWPGIDVAYHGTNGRLEYDFIVAPGADPNSIGLAFDGADAVRLDPATGDLLVSVGDGELRQERPTVYQDTAEGRSPVEGRFVLRGGLRVGFSVDGYDASRPLVIDPPLAWEGYIAGVGVGADDRARSVVTNAAGEVFVAGMSASFSFPTVLGPEASTATGRNRPIRDNAFLSKISASGSSLLYQTHFGGSYNDEATGVAVDEAGNAYVCGNTASSDFPTTPGALDSRGLGSHRTQQGDGFVVKFDTHGSAIGFSTYVGGTGKDETRGIVRDTSGRVVVVGSSDADLPSTYGTGPTAFQPTRPGGNDVFVIWIDPDGSAVRTSTWIGGASYEFATSVVADPAGGVVVAGGSYSPGVSGANPIREHSGAYDLFVAKLGGGADLQWFTFLGGSGSEPGAYASVDLDAQGRVLLASTTDSADFPTTPGAYDRTYHGGTTYKNDAVVARLSASGVLDWATFLGGSDDEYPVALAVDRTTGACLLSGGTKSTDFPTVAATQSANAGDYDGFVAELDASGSTLSFSTYHGGSAADWLESVASAPGNAICVAGETFSELQGAATSFQPHSHPNMDLDCMVAKFAPGGPPAETIALVPLKGKLLDRPNASVRVSGRLSFLPNSPDGRFDPSVESFTLTMGNRLNPHVLFIPPGAGWKSRSGRLTWKTPGRRNPHLSLVIDTRTRTFAVTATQFGFPVGVTGQVFLSIASGDDAGTDERTWRAKGKGRFELR